jgi:hypothetical protein
MSRKLFDYIAANKFIAILGAYFFLSVILNAYTAIDICIPCIWKTLFGVSCPSCGLTSALINLIKLDIAKAIDCNWLIFVLIPIGVYYLLRDIKLHLSNVH